MIHLGSQRPKDAFCTGLKLYGSRRPPYIWTVQARHFGSQTGIKALRPVENLLRSVSFRPGGCVVLKAKTSW